MNIKYKDKNGEYEFNDVNDLIALQKTKIVEDHDMKQFGYLISNLKKKELSKLIAFCSKGLDALIELRTRGMDAMVKELGNDSV